MRVELQPSGEELTISLNPEDAGIMFCLMKYINATKDKTNVLNEQESMMASILEGELEFYTANK